MLSTNDKNVKLLPSLFAGGFVFCFFFFDGNDRRTNVNVNVGYSVCLIYNIQMIILSGRVVNQAT